MKIKLSLFSMIAIFLLPIIINAQEIDKTDTYIFKAKIISISMVNTENALYLYDYGEFEKRKNGSIFVAGIDSHWAVKMEIISVNSDKNVLGKNEQITFVVHSPARNIGFLENDAIGKEVNLVLHITHEKNNAVSLSIYPLKVPKEVKTRDELVKMFGTSVGFGPVQRAEFSRFGRHVFVVWYCPFSGHAACYLHAYYFDPTKAEWILFVDRFVESTHDLSPEMPSKGEELIFRNADGKVVVKESVAKLPAEKWYDKKSRPKRVEASVNSPASFLGLVPAASPFALAPRCARR